MGKLYLVPSSSSKTQNVKDEYITIQNGSSYEWEQIGSTAIDLTDYATKAWVEAKDYALDSDLADVAKSGDYEDLINTPTIPEQMQSDWTQTDITSADYIKNKPTIPADIPGTSQVVNRFNTIFGSLETPPSDYEYPPTDVVNFKLPYNYTPFAMTEKGQRYKTIRIFTVDAANNGNPKYIEVLIMHTSDVDLDSVLADIKIGYSSSETEHKEIRILAKTKSTSQYLRVARVKVYDGITGERIYDGDDFVYTGSEIKSTHYSAIGRLDVGYWRTNNGGIYVFSPDFDANFDGTLPSHSESLVYMPFTPFSYTINAGQTQGTEWDIVKSKANNALSEIDTKISASSSNPVQNKVIESYLEPVLGVAQTSSDIGPMNFVTPELPDIPAGYKRISCVQGINSSHGVYLVCDYKVYRYSTGDNLNDYVDGQFAMSSNKMYLMLKASTAIGGSLCYDSKLYTYSDNGTLITSKTASNGGGRSLSTLYHADGSSDTNYGVLESYGDWGTSQTYFDYGSTTISVSNYAATVSGVINTDVGDYWYPSGQSYKRTVTDVTGFEYTFDGQAPKTPWQIVKEKVDTLENTPIATTSVAGKVIPDGTTITVDADGTIHSSGGSGSSGADWDAQSGEDGYIENKPFDVVTESPETLIDGTLNYETSLKNFVCITNYSVGEVPFQLGDTVDILIDDTSIGSYELVDISGVYGHQAIGVNLIDPDNPEDAQFDLICIDDPDYVSYVTFKYYQESDTPTHTELKINKLVEVVTKLSGDKIQIDGESIISDDGVLKATAPPQEQVDWDEDDPDSVSYIQNKPTIPVLVQSDWNETDTTDPAYIQNKPTIPPSVTVDDALSMTSVNPVQNKVISSKLSTVLGVPTDPSQTPVNFTFNTLPPFHQDNDSQKVVGAFVTDNMNNAFYLEAVILEDETITSLLDIGINCLVERKPSGTNYYYCLSVKNIGQSNVSLLKYHIYTYAQNGDLQYSPTNDYTISDIRVGNIKAGSTFAKGINSVIKANKMNLYKGTNVLGMMTGGYFQEEFIEIPILSYTINGEIPKTPWEQLQDKVTTLEGRENIRTYLDTTTSTLYITNDGSDPTPSNE